MKRDLDSPPLAAPIRAFASLSPQQLIMPTQAAPWLWTGYLRAGSVTLLTGPWKGGKSTLLALLLARMHTGGELAAQAVRPGKAVVVSEEALDLWAERHARLHFGDHVSWICRPFSRVPTTADWLALVEHLLELRRQHGTDLVAIDPLAGMLPADAESNAGLMLEALTPLQQLTSAGLAVLLLHHPRKARSAEGQAARGSGSLSGFVDILIEMQYHGTASSDDRRRRLLAYSRFDETPRRQVIERNAEGTDYTSLGDSEDSDFGGGWSILQALLADASAKHTRAELLRAWPGEHAAPSSSTLWRWLDRAASAGLVCREGTGLSNDPHRYWLKGQEEKWRPEG